MKLINILVFVTFCSIRLFSQGQEDPPVWFVELMLGFQNCPQPNSYTFYLENQGTVWATHDDFIPPGFFINEDPTINDSYYPWHVRNTVGNDWRGWNMVFSQDHITILDTLVPVFGYGLYKISTNASNSYFYIDYRDARIPYLNIIYNQNIDHWIKYDFNNHNFYYSTYGTIGPWTQIENREYLKIWEMQETYPVIISTSDFSNYWENCLVPVNDGSGYPRIVWGRHPQDDLEIEVDNYKIYRAVSSGLPPPNPIFIPIATVGSNIYSFTDYDFASGGPLNLQYRITAIYEDFVESVYETSPTNTVLIRGSLYKDNFKKDQKIEFFLSNNYPNPFNPVTTIDYKIVSTGLVTLIVYDMLGTEVASLVNEIKEAGNYSIKFNAEKLPSGIYFYQLRASDFAGTKKLILLK